jgi:hypothetical protein
VYTTLPEDTDLLVKQRIRCVALKAAPERALMSILAYTAVRVGELPQGPNDPPRYGVRWEDISLDDGSMDIYRKKRQWDAASLPDPVISPLQSYRQLLDPPTDRWPVFPTFDQRTLAVPIQNELVDRGKRPDAIAERREEYDRDLLLALDEDIQPHRLRRTAHRRFSSDSRRLRTSTLSIRNPIILLRTTAVEEWVRSLFARLGIHPRLDIWIIRRIWLGSGTHISRLENSVM